MGDATALRRARLVLSIGVPALGAAILIPSCAAWMAHDSPGRPAATRPAAAAGPRPGTQHSAAAPRPTARRSPSFPNGADAELAMALAPVLRGHPGRLAVGVIDEYTGAMATYHGSWSFNTASIIKADILAVLLIQHQQIGTAVSSPDRQLATAMIEDSDNNATTALWDDVEGGMGLEAGNAVLGLRHTWPSLTGAWGLTTATVSDQLRLLTDLTSARSPLDAANRAYELSLMGHVEVGQNWGITTAADPGSSPAVNPKGNPSRRFGLSAR
jgi:beta-lactamase class A